MVCDIASCLDYTMKFVEDFYHVVKMGKCLPFDMCGRLINLLNYSAFGVLINHCKTGRRTLTGL